MKIKSLIAATSVMMGALTAQANYTITFDTFDPADNFTQHLVFDVNGSTPLSGPGFNGQLYVGSSAGSLSAIGTPQPFQTGSPGAGFIAAGEIVVTDGTLNPGSSAFYQLKAWETGPGVTSFETALAAGNKIGASQVMAINLGGTVAGNPPTFLVATANLHPSFALVPEPSTWALGLLGLGALFMRRRS